MKSEINKDVYHANIIVSLQYLLIKGEDSAKLIAKENAQHWKTPDLEDDFFNGAKLIAEQFKKTEHQSSEILQYIPLYIKFLKKYNPDFSKKTFLNRTFRGAAFNSKDINNLEQATKNISFFLIRCLNGAAEHDWFS
tara:strand:- start:2232 stop:2642 length:411 start_codon:yes stop_codon:yes gene_type:complete